MIRGRFEVGTKRKSAIHATAGGFVFSGKFLVISLRIQLAGEFCFVKTQRGH